MLLTSTQLGSLALRADTSDAVFFESPVFAEVVVASPDFEYGIETGAWSGDSDVATGQPAYFYQPPAIIPLNVDVRHRRELQLTYRDEPIKTAVVPNAYAIKVYLTIVEKDPELEKLPEPQRTQAYERALSAYTG